jgi:hypothetical protein
MKIAVTSGTYNLIPQSSWADKEIQTLVLECDSTAGAITINLPSIAALNAQNLKVTISDVAGLASTNAITIKPGSNDLVNSVNTDVVLRVANGSVVMDILSDTSWSVVEYNVAVKLPKKYKALINQAAPATITSGTLLVGAIYTVTTFVAGDNFSNQELISGTVNTTGSKFRATSDTPTDVNGNIRPFVDSVGAPTFEFISTGYFKVKKVGAFPENKVMIRRIEAVPPVNGRTYEAVTEWWDADEIRIKTVRVVDGTTRTATDGCLFKTAFEFEVNE